jgi:NADH dehydrogenase FAD-containing subunit
LYSWHKPNKSYQQKDDKGPLIVIVGDGFAAKALGRAPVRVLLIDQSKHHVCQVCLCGSLRPPIDR